jgi:hypothetical protein
LLLSLLAQRVFHIYTCTAAGAVCACSRDAYSWKKSCIQLACSWTRKRVKTKSFLTDNSRKNWYFRGIFCEKIRLRRAWYRTESDEWDRSRNRPKLNFVFVLQTNCTFLHDLEYQAVSCCFFFCDLDLYGPVHLYLSFFSGLQCGPRMGPDTPAFGAFVRTPARWALLSSRAQSTAALRSCPCHCSVCSIAVRKLNIYSDSFGPAYALGRRGRRLVPSLLSTV